MQKSPAVSEAVLRREKKLLKKYKSKTAPVKYTAAFFHFWNLTWKPSRPRVPFEKGGPADSPVVAAKKKKVRQSGRVFILALSRRV